MNGVMLSVDLTCGIILKCAATIALLALAWLLWQWSKRATISLWYQNGPTPYSTGTSSVVHFDFAPTEAVTGTPQAAPPAKPVEDKAATGKVAVAIKPEPTPVPLMESIECGSCHKDIRSQPVTSMLVDRCNWSVYVCEHCGTQVKLQVT